MMRNLIIATIVLAAVIVLLLRTSPRLTDSIVGSLTIPGGYESTPHQPPETTVNNPEAVWGATRPDLKQNFSPATQQAFRPPGDANERYRVKYEQVDSSLISLIDDPVFVTIDLPKDVYEVWEPLLFTVTYHNFTGRDVQIGSRYESTVLRCGDGTELKFDDPEHRSSGFGYSQGGYSSRLRALGVEHIWYLRPYEKKTFQRNYVDYFGAQTLDRLATSSDSLFYWRYLDLVSKVQVSESYVFSDHATRKKYDLKKYRLIQDQKHGISPKQFYYGNSDTLQVVINEPSAELLAELDLITQLVRTNPTEPTRFEARPGRWQSQEQVKVRFRAEHTDPGNMFYQPYFDRFPRGFYSPYLIYRVYQQVEISGSAFVEWYQNHFLAQANRGDDWWTYVMGHILHAHSFIDEAPVIELRQWLQQEYPESPLTAQTYLWEVRSVKAHKIVVLDSLDQGYRNQHQRQAAIAYYTQSLDSIPAGYVGDKSKEYNVVARLRELLDLAKFEPDSLW